MEKPLQGLYKDMFFFIFVFFFLTFSGCTQVIKLDSSYKKLSNSEVFTVWVISDIQPRNEQERETFLQAVEDINRNVSGIDMVIVAGDIASRANENTYQWYEEIKSRSYVKEWYEIMGNHDLKNDSGSLFKELVRPETDYKIEKGNLVFMFLSDSQRGKATVISNEVFHWWRSIVKYNENKVLITVTHAPLKGSPIPFSSLKGRHILDSKRFIDVIKSNPVDIWISGHLHLPHRISNTIYSDSGDIDGTAFVNVSSIRRELWGLKHSESRVFYFICNSNKVFILSRDHDKQRWDGDLTKSIILSKQIKCEDSITGKPTLYPYKVVDIIGK